ncbi:hypothetical protein K1T71_000676 [Dendrolimus kikuchii]|uniref:Uncharacterized protein n=1 Tax=Dendrolimus kikuchii TaxID=765133 RepID=A0ACC1DJW7_9NEOP|nr:hypothetical protein K1T71_000676 [Dendrolimus kikuchii]
MLAAICRLNSSYMQRVSAMPYSTGVKPKTAIVMLNMGGPQTTAQVGDYLHRIMTDRDMIQLPVQSKLGPWIASRRTEEVKKKYQEIGGGSPILQWTHSQVSLQYKPHSNYIKDGKPTNKYAQYKVPRNIQFSMIERWATHPLLAKVFAERILEKLELFDSKIRNDVLILFTAHSLPLKAVSRGDTYPHEVAATVAATMEALNLPNPHRLVWQSKVGPLPWLQPYTDDAIKSYAKQGRRHMILVPIAFVNEHIETLHELDIEYCEDVAKEVGIIQIERASAPNDHPTFIGALAEIVSNHLTNGPKISNQFLTRCPHCVSKRCQSSKDFFRKLCGNVDFNLQSVVSSG